MFVHEDLPSSSLTLDRRTHFYDKHRTHFYDKCGRRNECEGSGGSHCAGNIRTVLNYRRTRWRTDIRYLMYVVMCFVWLVSLSAITAASIDHDKKDFRYTRYQDLVFHGSRFQHSNLMGYTQLVLDDIRNQLLVGAKDTLFRLSLDDLRVLEATEWKSPESTMRNCLTQGQTEENCHNFVRILLLYEEEQVFTCGTNAYDPVCTRRPVSNLSSVINGSNISGKAICPYDPNHNTTALITRNGDLYAATIIDKLAREPAIIRKLGSSTHLRTETNSLWLNEPNFVSTYEFGNFVYFFYRETAVEYINCGKKVYSRAARVCKNDKGGDFLWQGKWTSFHKARLNCSLPGNFPFYFEEIQSTFYSTSEDLVYAIFTTPSNAIAGSAVCVYNMTAFDTVFNGPFKHQSSATSAWTRQENDIPDSKKCNSETGGQKRSSENSANHLLVTQAYQLMDMAVQPATASPLIVKEQERWTHIVVDHVVGKKNRFDVFFLATEDGKVQKMMRLPDSSTTCLVEEIKIVPNGHPRPVKSMKLSPSKGAVYLSTDGTILRIPVQRCNRFQDKSKCLAARDPYCGWDNFEGKCSPPPGKNPHTNGWEQEIPGCPNTQIPEDGVWSLWSPWNKCKQVGSDPMVDQCLCRSRLCDNPAPSNGGVPCMGASMEVANCTVHGQWTEWSEWSACSQTCGYAVRLRRRSCGNPPPKFGGKSCTESDTEKQYCSDNPECPLPSVDGNWSLWSGWSACTKNCNGGIQTRRRACDQPRPSRGGMICAGNLEEWRMCNTQECSEMTRISPWTEWVPTNHTTGGYFEQRFRFTCRANVPNRKLIKASYAKSQARFCLANGHGCRSAGELKNSITSIDTFSSVDRVLRKFCRYKRKLFEKYCNCRTLGVFLVCQKCGYG